MLSARWDCVGVVVERREVKSEKNKQWVGYFVKLATLGMVVELDCTAAVFAKLGDGEIVGVRGGFGMGREGGVKFKADEVFPASPAKPVKS